MASLLPVPEPADPIEGALGHFEHSNWVKQALKNLDAGTVHAVGGSAGSLTVDTVTIDDDASQDALIKLKGSGSRGVWSYNAAGVARWRLLLGDPTAETGNNSGSLFKLLAYGDDGSARATVLQADRNSGLVTAAADPTAALGVATKQYVDSAVPLGAIIAYGGGLPLTGRMAAEWHPCDGTVHGSTPLQNLIGAKTPDLAGMFVVGAGLNKDATTGALTNYAIGVGAKAGKETVKLKASESGEPGHGHTAPSTGTISADHRHSIPAGEATTSDISVNHAHTLNRTLFGAFNGVNQDGDISYRASPTKFASLYAAGTNAGDSGHTHTVTIPAATSGYVDSNHTHTVTVYDKAAADAATAHENRPPYYALVYIIKKV